MLEGCVILGCAFGLVAEVQVWGFANVLGDVVGRVLWGFDERAVDVVGVAGYGQPLSAKISPVDEGGCGDYVEVRVPFIKAPFPAVGAPGAAGMVLDFDDGVAGADGRPPELAVPELAEAADESIYLARQGVR